MSLEGKNLKLFMFTAGIVFLSLLGCGNNGNGSNSNYGNNPLAEIQNRSTAGYVYARELNFEEAGIYLMKLENDPYPFFFITVSDSTVLRDEALLPILEQIIDKNKLKKKINLNPNN